MGARPVLLYDAGCRLCRFSARLVERLDRNQRLAFLPLGASEAEPLLEPLAPAERFASWRLAGLDGSLTGRGAGASSVLRAIGRERTAAVLAALPDKALEAAYDLIVRYRGRLGRLVPDSPGPRRFP